MDLYSVTAMPDTMLMMGLLAAGPMIAVIAMMARIAMMVDGLLAHCYTGDEKGSVRNL